MNYTTAYEALMARILATVPAVQYVDWFNQQILTIEEGDELPFNTPAVFIEFAPANSSTQGRRAQLDEVIVRLYLVTESFSETASIEAPETREAALAENELAQLLVTNLLGFSCDHFGALSNQGVTTDHDFSSIKGTPIAFRTIARNVAATPVTEPHTADVVIVQGRCN